jgi:23S rRNA (uracil1939-C5)-methyltransferase
LSEKKYPVGRGTEYTLDIEKLAFGGAGITRLDNYVIFVKGALPGDRVVARIQKRKPTFAEAKLIAVEKPSEKRINPPCPYFEWCGGCTWQNLSYDDQIKFKQEIVAESLEHIAGLEEIEIQPVLKSEKYFGYRNKMEFSFSDRRWLLPHELNNEDISNKFALGLHVPDTFDKILQIDSCMLQSDTANALLKHVNDYVLSKALEPYGIKNHKGFLRFLVIRESEYENSLMVNIVTAYDNHKILKPLADQLTESFPDVKSVVNNINSKLAQIAFGEQEILLAGKPVIKEKLGRHIFNISANSFFQTNTRQAERLYDKVKEFVELAGTEELWDLYCGTGTISIILAEYSKHVTGFELVESAVVDARKNADEHGVKNIKFISGDLLHSIKGMKTSPDIIVTDPPRSGMHPRVVEYLKILKPARIVYVSCNPTTLSRDLAILKDTYSVDLVQPVDMFPQTYHIETVVKLSRL